MHKASNPRRSSSSLHALLTKPNHTEKERKKMMTRATTAAMLLLLPFLLDSAGAQPAAAPSPAGPTNITHILEKAGQFTVLIRMMKSTQVGDQINNQLNNSNGNGLTVFAPTDNAFASLPAGTLNSLSDQQKVELLQFHVLPTLLTMQQFQTVSNPLRTQAGSGGRFPLNVTATGNQVNISTGVDSTTVSNTLYSDSQLAVYEVDKVLMPIDIFGPPAPAPPPETGDGGDDKKKGGASSSDAPASADKTKAGPAGDSSAGGDGRRRGAGAMAAAAAVAVGSFFWWVL